MKNKTEQFLTSLKTEMEPLAKSNSNFMINPVLRREFKLECYRNTTTMSQALESLLLSYVVKSKQLHGELDNRNGEVKGSDIVFE